MWVSSLELVLQTFIFWNITGNLLWKFNRFNRSLLFITQVLHYYRYQNVLSLSKGDINNSITFAKEINNNLKRLETSLSWSNIHVKQGTPSHAQLIESHPEDIALQQSGNALIAAKVFSHLIDSHCYRHNINLKKCIKHISSYNLRSSSLSDACPSKICTPEELHAKYRSIDGSCNNIFNSLYGMSFTEFRRLLPPDYSDGVQEIRRSVDAKYELPSPRLVSTTFNKQRDRKGNLTLAFMQWTQFVEHDISSIASRKTVFEKKSIACCREDGMALSPRYIHPSCASIEIPINDIFYSKHSVTCMPYVRSIAAINIDCKLGPLNQLNQATHFLDGSQIYGSSTENSNKLREFRNGLLQSSSENTRHFLPKLLNASLNCRHKEKSNCYVSGDFRVNIYPHLTVMHILWLREHNRIARELRLLNSHWNDKKIFQESRRLVIALLQHITFNEYLPILLGKSYWKNIYMKKTNLEVMDPRISNSFATAAFKFSNSLLDNQLEFYDRNNNLESTLSFIDYFSKPKMLEEFGNLDKLVRGLSSQKAQLLDMDFVDAVSNQLYQYNAYGLDSFSLDIQRTRDHGIPNYLQFRKRFGFPSVNTFENLRGIIPKSEIDLLKKVYRNVNDIDLIVGGMAEIPLDGSLLGPTFSQIIVDQMKRLKFGDRFFFDNVKNPHRFTYKQIIEIRKATLARIFCDNGDKIEFMQPQVFKEISINNALVSCKDIPYVNLNLWAEHSNNV